MIEPRFLELRHKVFSIPGVREFSVFCLDDDIKIVVTGGNRDRIREVVWGHLDNDIKPNTVLEFRSGSFWEKLKAWLGWVR